MKLIRVALTVAWIVATCIPSLARGNITLLGAGATFPYPLYSKWFDVYYRTTGVRVNYQAIGSGGGIRQLLRRVVDFGATDAFMSDEELKKAPGPIIHIPMALGAVVITYNLPGSPTLRFTPEVVADIFLGKITYWDHPRIKSLNPNVKLPHRRIVVVHRSDGSGTTAIFTDYLCKVSREWRAKVGKGKSVNWPTGLGGKGNPGVAGLIAQIPGSIGYVELAYAKQNNLPVAILKNKAGKWVKPTLKAVSAAANIPLPPDTRVSITDTEAPDGYPISGFTWIIIYKEQNYARRSLDRARALVKLLWWCIHDAQKYNESLLYGRLPQKAVEISERLLEEVTYNGKPILR